MVQQRLPVRASLLALFAGLVVRYGEADEQAVVAHQDYEATLADKPQRGSGEQWHAEGP